MTVAIEAILRRERVIVVLALVAVVGLCWIYLLAGAGTGMPALEMSALPTSAALTGPMAAMQPMAWTPQYAVVLLAMWWGMMLAMMLPAAAPMILMYAAIARRQEAAKRPLEGVLAFAAGYLVLWGCFSIVAVLLQWGLERLALASPLMVVSSVVLGALLLIAAGIWQFTPLKQVCLRHCRSPPQFVMLHWRSGTGGAFRMGLRHGGLCLGCCWFLMLLLFYGGVMNIWWVLGLTSVVLIEKLAPAGARLGLFLGAGLIAWGVALLVGLS